MLFVQSWEDAPQAMMDLYADTAALNARQLQLMTWYKRYMTKVALSLERMVVGGGTVPCGQRLYWQQQFARVGPHKAPEPVQLQSLLYHCHHCHHHCV